MIKPEPTHATLTLFLSYLLAELHFSLAWPAALRKSDFWTISVNQ